MKDVEITVCKEYDIEALCNFEKEARETEKDIWGWNFNEEDYINKLKMLNIDDMENTKIIVAKYKDKIVGRCDISINFTLVDFNKTGYVDWIYTLKGNRCMGIGKKLLRGAEEYFKSKGVSSFYLFTASNNEAQQFYHRQNELSITKEEVAKRILI